MPSSVMALSTNAIGDLIVGTEDKKIRVFTRDPTRVAATEETAAFEGEVKESDGGNEIQLEGLPTMAEMSQHQGNEG